MWQGILTKSTFEITLIDPLWWIATSLLHVLQGILTKAEFEKAQSKESWRIMSGPIQERSPLSQMWQVIHTTRPFEEAWDNTHMWEAICLCRVWQVIGNFKLWGVVFYHSPQNYHKWDQMLKVCSHCVLVNESIQVTVLYECLVPFWAGFLQWG